MVDSNDLPEIDINQIATDLNLKMDRDAVNATDELSTKVVSELTTEDKEKLTHLFTPSTSYINVPYQVSGTLQPMPADGFLMVAHNRSSGYFELVNDSKNGMGVSANYTGGWARAVLPVGKGDIIHVYTNCSTSNIQNFRFFYAEGVKP